MARVSSQEWITFRVSYKGENETLRLPPDAQLKELSVILHSSFGALPATQKLLPRKRSKVAAGRLAEANDDERDAVMTDGDELSSGALLPDRHSGSSTSSAACGDWHDQPNFPTLRRKGMLQLVDAATVELSLVEAGVEQDSYWILLASTDEDLTYVANLKEDPLLRGLEEEEALERIRQGYTSGPQKPPVALLNGYGFGNFRALTPDNAGVLSLSPPPEDALKLMYTLATDWGVVSVMKKYKWRVGIMTEMPPVGKVGISPRCVLGFNVNRGQEISLRLRTDDLRGFRKYEVIRSTLLHELTHMVFDDHDNNFKALNSKLVKEARVTTHHLNGATGSTSRFLGVLTDAVHGSGGGPQTRKLGGNPIDSHDPKAAVAAAALSRHLAIPEARESQEKERRSAPSYLEGTDQEHDSLDCTDEAVSYGRNLSSKDAGHPSPPPGVPQSSAARGALAEQHRSPATIPAELLLEDARPVDANFVSLEGADRATTVRDQSQSETPQLSGGNVAEFHAVVVPEELSTVATSSMDVQSKMKAALDQLEKEASSGTQNAQQAATVVRAIVRNVLEHPAEPKYRTIRKGNKKVQDSLMKFPAAMELLRLAGFRDHSSDSGTGEVLHCRAPDPGLLWLACALLEESSLVA